MLRIRMALRREDRREKSEIGACRMGERELFGGMAGGGEKSGNREAGGGDRFGARAPLHAPRFPLPGHPCRQVDPVGAAGPSQLDIAGDEKKDASSPADRRIAPRDPRASWIVIIAIDDGGAGGERAQDRFGPRDAAAVGQKSERKWRMRNPARTFERGGGRC